MLPFHSEADVDQKLLFSVARAALRGPLSMTATAAVSTSAFVINRQLRSRSDCNGATVTDCHSLFSAPAIAVMAATASVAETRAIAHPANFLSGKSTVCLEGLSIPQLCKDGCGEGLTFPHPEQSLQGLRPIPRQMWQLCM